MANINVGELIVVNALPTQTELNNKSITVGGVTKTFQFPVVFRKVGGGLTASVDYTYRNAIDAPVSSFNPDLSLIQSLNIDGTELKGVKRVLTVPEGIETITVNAFAGSGASVATQLSGVIFNEGLLSIGAQAFFTNKIVNPVFPSTLTSIDVVAFGSNPITAVTLPPNCTYKSNSFPAGTVITGGILIT